MIVWLYPARNIEYSTNIARLISRLNPKLSPTTRTESSPTYLQFETTRSSPRTSLENRQVVILVIQFIHNLFFHAAKGEKFERIRTSVEWIFDSVQVIRD